MITFKKIKAHFLMLAKRLEKRLVLIFQYFIRHPIRFLMVLIAILVLIAAIYVIKAFLFDEALPQNKPSQSVSVVVKQNDRLKNFGKDIKLHHAEVLNKKPALIQDKSNIKQEEPEIEQEVQDTKSDKKYAVWPIKKLPKVIKEEIKEEKISSAEVKEEVLTVFEQPQTEDEVQIEPQQTEDTDFDENKAVEKQTLEVKTNEEAEDAPKPVKTAEVTVQTAQTHEEVSTFPSLYRKVEGLGLTYLSAPVFLKGEAIVYGANELYIDGKYIYLYGIYTDPMKYDEQKVTAYLHDLVTNGEIQCLVIAYTADGVGTALCFSADSNINQMLVDQNMADNIAL